MHLLTLLMFSRSSPSHRSIPFRHSNATNYLLIDEHSRVPETPRQLNVICDLCNDSNINCVPFLNWIDAISIAKKKQVNSIVAHYDWWWCCVTLLNLSRFVYDCREHFWHCRDHTETRESNQFGIIYLPFKWPAFGFAYSAQTDNGICARATNERRGRCEQKTLRRMDKAVAV